MLCCDWVSLYDAQGNTVIMYVRCCVVGFVCLYDTQGNTVIMYVRCCVVVGLVCVIHKAIL